MLVNTRLSFFGVAPLAGSVDRNQHPLDYYNQGKRVAPLAGSVDRNTNMIVYLWEKEKSLPSRGAWIEMTTSRVLLPCWTSRSPRGERG